MASVNSAAQPALASRFNPTLANPGSVYCFFCGDGPSPWAHEHHYNPESKDLWNVSNHLKNVEYETRVEDQVRGEVRNVKRSYQKWEVVPAGYHPECYICYARRRGEIGRSREEVLGAPLSSEGESESLRTRESTRSFLPQRAPLK